MIDDAEYHRRRNEIAVAIRNDTKLEHLIDHCNNMYSHLMRDKQEGNKSDFEMIFCLGSFQCQNAMCNKNGKTNLKELTKGINILELCYKDKNLGDKAKEYVAKVSQVLLGKEDVSQEEKIHFLQYAKMNEPTVLLLESLFYFEMSREKGLTPETEKIFQERNITLAAKVMREYAKIKGSDTPPHYYFPILLASLNERAAKDWDQDIFAGNSPVTPGWQWKGDTVLAMLQYEKGNTNEVVTHLIRAINNLSLNIDTTAGPDKPQLETIKKGLESSIVAIYKEIGRKTLKTNGELPVDTYAKVANIHPDDLEARFILGSAAFMEKDWSSAFEHFDRITQIEDGQQLLGKHDYIAAYVFAWHKNNGKCSSEAMIKKLNPLIKLYPQQKHLSRLILNLHQAIARGEKLKTSANRVLCFGYDPLKLSIQDNANDSMAKTLLDLIQAEIEAKTKEKTTQGWRYLLFK